MSGPNKISKGHSFWQSQTSSRHRYDSDAFFAAKAQEHADLFLDEEKTRGACDIGCGDGRLLAHLSRQLTVSEALDYSASMVPIAQKAVMSQTVKVVHADALQYLAATPPAIWMSTAAINQYFSAAQMQELLALFVSSSSSTGLFLFDTIDPLRYPLLALGARYDDQEKGATGTLAALAMARRWLVACGRILLACMRPDPVPLGRTAMGYGYTPQYWWKYSQRAASSLDIQIVSSRYYEYRYHVLIRKSGSSARSSTQPL